MDLSDGISSRADDFSTLKEFFESDPAIELQIRRCFAKFLQGYRSEGEFVYLRLIQDLCLQNRKSLEVSYMYLAKCSPTLAIWVADCPAVVLNNFNLSARTVAEELFQTNRSVVPEHIFVRIDDLPIVDVITDVLSNQINDDPRGYTGQLIKIRGKVKSSTLVSPHVQKVMIEEVDKSWFTEGSLNAIEVMLRDDLVRRAPLGDIIEVTGITHIENGNDPSLTPPSVYMEANHISPLDFLWGEDNPDSDYNFVMINNFMQFLEHFEVEVESGKSFSYDTKLRECLEKLVWQLDIDFDHLNQYDAELHQAVFADTWGPGRYFQLMEIAVNLYFESEVLPRNEKMMTPIEVKFRVSGFPDIDQHISSRFSVKHENSLAVVKRSEREIFFGLRLDAFGQIQREPLQKRLYELRERRALDFEVNRVLGQMDDDNRNRLMHTMNTISESKPRRSRHQSMLEARSLILGRSLARRRRHELGL